MKFILYILSPTLFLASRAKKKWDATLVIKTLNNVYLFMSVLLVAFFWSFANSPFDYSQQSVGPSIILSLYLWSRSLEILVAFIADAIDKTKPIKKSSSKLTPKDRIKLSLKSYIELILIFGIGYWLMPCSWWESAPSTVIESLYFSGVTITTLGYGDIRPNHPIPQLLTVFEVLCGFSLLVVSFAIYTGLEHDESKEP